MVSIYKVSSLQTAWIAYAALSSIVVIRTIFFMPITIIPSPLPDDYNMDVTVDCCTNSCKEPETKTEANEPDGMLNVRNEAPEQEESESKTFTFNAENLGCGKGGFWTTSNAFHPLFLSSLLYTIIK